MFFAGIWEESADHGLCAAILTEPTAPNLETIHNRQPVVLDPQCRYDWLSQAITQRDQIKGIAQRLDPETLTSWPVTPAMNRPDHDDATIIEPVEAG